MSRSGVTVLSKRCDKNNFKLVANFIRPSELIALDQRSARWGKGSIFHITWMLFSFQFHYQFVCSSRYEDTSTKEEARRQRTLPTGKNRANGTGYNAKDLYSFCFPKDASTLRTVLCVSPPRIYLLLSRHAMKIIQRCGTEWICWSYNITIFFLPLPKPCTEISQEEG